MNTEAKEQTPTISRSAQKFIDRSNEEAARFLKLSPAQKYQHEGHQSATKNLTDPMVILSSKEKRNLRRMGVDVGEQTRTEAKDPTRKAVVKFSKMPIAKLSKINRRASRRGIIIERAVGLLDVAASSETPVGEPQKKSLLSRGMDFLKKWQRRGAEGSSVKSPKFSKLSRMLAAKLEHFRLLQKITGLVIAERFKEAELFRDARDFAKEMETKMLSDANPAPAK